MSESEKGKLYQKLHSTCVYGIVHQKPISLEIDDILDEAKAEIPKVNFTIMDLEHEIKILKTSSEDKRVLISWMQCTLEMKKWFEKWFG